LYVNEKFNSTQAKNKAKKKKKKKKKRLQKAKRIQRNNNNNLKEEKTYLTNKKRSRRDVFSPKILDDHSDERILFTAADGLAGQRNSVTIYLQKKKI